MTPDSSRFDRLTQVLRNAIDARLQPPYLRLVFVGVVILSVSFATSDRGWMLFGPPLGNNFVGFLVAEQIVEWGEASRLYGRELHDQLYHELLPNLAEGDSIPYVHPPFVAGVLRTDVVGNDDHRHSSGRVVAGVDRLGLLDAAVHSPW